MMGLVSNIFVFTITLFGAIFMGLLGLFYKCRAVTLFEELPEPRGQTWNDQIKSIEILYDENAVNCWLTAAIFGGCFIINLAQMITPKITNKLQQKIRAQSLSPTMQQLQTHQTDYNYLNRNYQPTWVDTIDNIYQNFDIIKPNLNQFKPFEFEKNDSQQQFINQQTYQNQQFDENSYEQYNNQIANSNEYSNNFSTDHCNEKQALPSTVQNHQNQSIITQVYKINPAQCQTYVIENHAQLPTTTRQIYHNIQIETIPQLQQQQLLQNQLNSPTKQQYNNFLPIENTQQQILHQHFIPSNQLINFDEPKQTKQLYQQKVVNKQQYEPHSQKDIIQKQIYINNKNLHNPEAKQHFNQQTIQQQCQQQPFQQQQLTEQHHSPQQQNINDINCYLNYQQPIKNNDTKLIQKQFIYSKPNHIKETQQQQQQQQQLINQPVQNIIDNVNKTITTTKVFNKTKDYQIENNNPNVIENHKNEFKSNNNNNYQTDNIIEKNYLINLQQQKEPIFPDYNKDKEIVQQNFYIQQIPKKTINYLYKNHQPQQNLNFCKQQITNQPKNNLNKHQNNINNIQFYEQQNLPAPYNHNQKSFESTTYIPNRQLPTFTTNFTINQPNSIKYKQRSKSTDTRHICNFDNEYKQKYLIGGIDFNCHNEPLKFQPNDFEIPNQKKIPSKNDKKECPVRQNGEQFGLNYNLHPAATNINTDNSSNYHGYAPLSPRQHWKFDADLNVPLNNFEIKTIESVNPNRLIGDTLSNQKVCFEKYLTDEEKRNFCVEFAPPAGFKPDHKTIIYSTNEKEHEPICYSLSAKKHFSGAVESNMPNFQNQEQYKDKYLNTNTYLNQNTSWYVNGNKEVMQTEPNWSRNVNLRTHAWELEEFNKNKKYQIQGPTWVRFGKTQQSIPPKTAHWIKQQNNVEKNYKDFEQNQNNLNYNYYNDTQQNLEYQTVRQSHDNNLNPEQWPEWHKELEKPNFQPNYNNVSDNRKVPEENEENFITGTRTITTIRNDINGNIIQKIIQHPNELSNNKQQNQFKIISNHQKNNLNKLTQGEEAANQFNQNQYQQQPRIKINEFCS